MRAHQLANSDTSRPLQMFGVPICCCCTAPAKKDRYEHFTNHLSIRVNGLLIEDAVSSVLGYVEGGRYVRVEFTGTIAVFARGLEDAAKVAKLPQVEFVDGWIEGLGHSLQVSIEGDIVMMRPLNGKNYSLAGAK